MAPPPKILTLSSWNARGGINQKKPILTQFLKDYSIGILFLQETWLTPDRSFSIPNYIITRTDRTSSAGGGTAILTRRSIPHTPYQLPPTTALECTAVAIGSSTSQILLISCYKTPHIPIPDSDFDTIKNLPYPFIIAGDLNSKSTSWGCMTSNATGLRLEHFIDTNPQIQLKVPTEPTHLVQNNPHDILDIILHSSQVSITIPHPKYDLYDLSDHLPIIFTSSSTSNYILPKPAPIPNTDWKTFKRLLSKKIHVPPTILTTQSIDNSINHLTHHLKQSYRKTTTYSKNTHPTLPDEILTIIRYKRQVQRRYYKYRRDDDKRELKRTQKTIHNLLKHHETHKYDELLTDNSSPNTIHKIIKTIRNHPTPISPILTSNNTLTFDPQTITNTLAQSLAERFRPSNIPIPDSVLWNFLETPPLPPDQQRTWTTNDNEIKTILKTIDCGKSPGPDGVLPSQLTHLTKNAIDLITLILNSCLKLSYFPSAWKIARVTMIPKPGKDHRLPSNHRPISLLPILGKLFEKIILLRLTPLLDPIITPNQFGFREGRSAALQTLNLALTIATPLQDRKEIPAIFTDLTQAYDTVSHPILLMKIRPYIPDHIHSLLQSYLTYRSFYIRHLSKTSPNYPIQAGVPQGAVLSPILFSMYINDVPQTPGVQTFLYADDLAFLSSFNSVNRSVSHLQEALNDFHLWASQNSIIINPSKSQAILFSYKTYPSNPPPITIGNEPIPWTTEISYLGVTFSRRLLWSHHIHRITVKATRITNTLHPILTNPHIPTKKKIQTYNSYIRPILTYAHPTWFTTSHANRIKLTRVENHNIRLIFRPPMYTIYNSIRLRNKIPHILTYLHNSTIAQIRKYINNPLFRNLILPHYHILRNPPRHTLKKHPLDILKLPPPIT